MKTSDWIAQRIKKEVDTVFGVQGGCIVNVVDSFKKAGNCKGNCHDCSSIKTAQIRD